MSGYTGLDVNIDEFSADDGKFLNGDNLNDVLTKENLLEVLKIDELGAADALKATAMAEGADGMTVKEYMQAASI